MDDSACFFFFKAEEEAEATQLESDQGGLELGLPTLSAPPVASLCSLRSFWAPTPATLQGPSRQSPSQVHLEKGQTDTGPSATLPKAGHPSFCLCPPSSPGRREAKQVLAPIFITDRTETWRACHPRARCPRMHFRV